MYLFSHNNKFLQGMKTVSKEIVTKLSLLLISLQKTKQKQNKTKQKKTPLISHFKREPFLNNGNRKLTKYNVHTSSKASIF